MRSRFLIFILIIIAIVVLACLLGPLIFNSYQNQRQDSQLTITSNITIYKGENFTAKLSDADGNPIANEQLKIVLLNESESFEFSVVTDSNGIGTLEMDKDFGKYTINCTFGGNGQYKPSNTIQRIEIAQKVIQAPDYVDASMTLNSSSNATANNGSYHNVSSTVDVYYDDSSYDDYSYSDDSYSYYDESWY